MKKIYLLLFIAISISLKAQQDSTTIQKNLDAVEIISKKISTKGKLEEVDGYIISAVSIQILMTYINKSLIIILKRFSHIIMKF